MSFLSSHLGRRKFLKISSVALASPSLIKASEDAARASDNNTKTSSKKLKTEELTADLVIVGGGGGGLSSAVRASQLGIKNIIVLEKRSVTGGNANNPSAPTGGMGGAPAGNPQDGRGGDLPGGESGQAGQMPPGEDGRGGGAPGDTEEGMPADSLYGASADYFFESAMEWSHWRMDARLVRFFLEKTPDVPKWIKELGIENVGGQRGVLAKRQTELCKELGVKILLKTPARELITDKNGKVVGVVAESRDNIYRIKAKCVILSTGGFLGNKDLMKRFCLAYDDTFYDDVVMYGLPHNGDGFLMAEAVGGVSDGTTAFEWVINRFPWLLISDPLVQLAEPRDTKGIWVNKKGLRFANEVLSTASNALYRQPNKTGWTIIDTKGFQNRRLQSFNGGDVNEKLQEQIEKQTKKGRVKVSDSLDEIAEAIGCDPSTLKATIEEYNSFCDKGKDLHFLRSADTLSALRTPPFYAIKWTLGMLMSRGPLKVNTNMEVVNKNDDPIPGLYAAGVDIGGTDSDTYWGTGPGHSYVWTIVSGCVASENAAKIILNQA